MALARHVGTDGDLKVAEIGESLPSESASHVRHGQQFWSLLFLLLWSRYNPLFMWSLCLQHAPSIAQLQLPQKQSSSYHKNNDANGFPNTDNADLVTETGTHMADCAEARGNSTVAVLGQGCWHAGVGMPVVERRHLPMVLTVQKTVEFPKLQFIGMPVVVQQQVPMVVTSCAVLG